MLLKRPCGSFQVGVTLLDPDRKEVGSCPSPDNSYLYIPECVCLHPLRCQMTVYLSHQHGPEQPLGRPHLGVDGSASPGGGDLISRQPLLP